MPSKRRSSTWPGATTPGASTSHVGVRGTDRAIAVCDALRGYLPHLLALSANSPLIDDVWTAAYSAGTQTFIACSRAAAYPTSSAPGPSIGGYYQALFATELHPASSRRSGGAVRPHYTYGTVEIRICDAQTEPWQTLAVTSLALGARSPTLASAWYDEGRRCRCRETATDRGEPVACDPLRARRRPRRLGRGREVPAPEAVRELIEWTRRPASASAWAPTSTTSAACSRGNGAQRQSRALAAGQSIHEMHADAVALAGAILGDDGR